MSWFRFELDLSPEQAGHRLLGQPGAFQFRDGERLFFGAFPTEEVDALVPPEQLSVSDEGHHIPQWLGVLPYEAFRFWERGCAVEGDRREPPLIEKCRWRRYDAVAEVTGHTLSVQGPCRDAVARLKAALSTETASSDRPAVSLSWLEAPEAGEIHTERVIFALSSIARGELYQVNLARRFRFRVVGEPIEILAALGPLAQAPFAAALDFGDFQVVSTSPELFLEHDPRSRRVVTRPIKGTRPRGPNKEEDERLARELDLSEKERAELAMVIDIERNDFGRLAEIGTVRLSEAPQVTSYPTVHHREAQVEAILRPDVSREELLRITMPSGSVTGAPKVRAMDLIAEKESVRRGLYTGALGMISHTGLLRLSMAIRVLAIRGAEAHYYAGGGIVADSDPAQELDETRWKAEQLRALIRV